MLELLNTGTPLTATTGQTVHLGTGMTPRGGTGTYSYSWTQTAGSPTVTLTGGTTGNPSFVAPTVTAATPLTFTMTVTDAAGSVQTATQTVTVSPASGSALSFTFDTTGGYDTTRRNYKSGQDGYAVVHFTSSGTAPLSYHWVQTQGPSIGDLSAVNGPNYDFTAPSVTGTQTIGLSVTVTDSSGTPQVVTHTHTFTITGTFVADGVRCLVCGDLNGQVPCTDMEMVIAELTGCPRTQPYCMNDIVQTNFTDVAQYKRCVGESECHSLWYQATSDEPLCLHYDPSNAEETLTCHLCCWNGGPNGQQIDLDKACNIDTVPPVDKLYRT